MLYNVVFGVFGCCWLCMCCDARAGVVVGLLGGCFVWLFDCGCWVRLRIVFVASWFVT